MLENGCRYYCANSREDTKRTKLTKLRTTEFLEFPSCNFMPLVVNYLTSPAINIWIAMKDPLSMQSGPIL